MVFSGQPPAHSQQQPPAHSQQQSEAPDASWAAECSGPQLHSAVRRCLRIFTGRVCSTPTTAIPSADDMGLLMFLGVKQAHLSAACRGLDLFRYPSLRALLSIVEFVNFVVGGLIVEAEKIDEMSISIRKEIVKREAAIDQLRYEQSLDTRFVGTAVHQVLAAHFPHRPPPTAPRRLSPAPDPAATEDPSALLEDEKWLLSQHRQHLRAAAQVRALLHGRRPPPSDAAEWDEVNITTSELGIVHTFRKAQQRVRDILIDVEDKDALPAVKSLTEFIDYLHYGMSAALEELEKCEVQLRKTNISEVAERRLEQLDAQDRRNKQASCSALQYNMAVNSPRKMPSAQSVAPPDASGATATPGLRVYESRPQRSTPAAAQPAAPGAGGSWHGAALQSRAEPLAAAAAVAPAPFDPRTAGPWDAASLSSARSRQQFAHSSAALGVPAVDDGFLDALCEE